MRVLDEIKSKGMYIDVKRAHIDHVFNYLVQVKKFF